MGRFMTPDWAAKPADVPYANFGNPESLNLYGYVENNPTTIGDPDGHGYIDPAALQDVAVGGAKGIWNMFAGTWNASADLLNAQGQASGQSYFRVASAPTASYDNV